MNHTFKNRSVISITNFSKQEILYLLEQAFLMKKSPPLSSLKTSILATCFYEPSTRTRLSFETAMFKLGGQVIGFSDIKNSAVQKGESFEDTMRIIGSFADVIILRHPSKDSIYLAHKSTKTPVINAGNGAEEHPTQTLTDLFTMQETQKDLEGLSVAFVGDLKYGRTVHSLCLACALFGMRLFFYAPDGLFLPQDLVSYLIEKKIQFSFHQNLEEIIPHIDILYITRLQTDRLTNSDPNSFNLYPLKLDHLINASSHLKILHPLPRNNEIDHFIDGTKFAYYFQQAENGVYTRMALLHAILQGSLKYDYV
ncbi:MAG: aspartate carbamoyltransferase [Candidatus Rhabdochlamydia sp.]